MHKQVSRIFCFFCLAIVCLSAFSQKKSNTVHLYGTVKNFENVVQIQDRDVTQPLQLVYGERQLVLDSKGRFSLKFDLTRPKYFQLGRNSLYLSPGDNLEVFIDFNDARNSRFKGSHKSENDYLKNTPYPKAGSFLEAGTKISATISQTIKKVLELADQRKRLLKKNKILSAEFRFLEANRIRADVLNSLYSLRLYFPYIHKLKGDSLIAFQKTFSDSLDIHIRKHIFPKLDVRLMKLEVYRHILPYILQSSDSVGKDAAQIRDWLFAKSVIHEMQTPDLDNSMTTKKINQIVTPEYRTQVLETYEKLKEYNGSIATDIELRDVNNKVVKVSTFRGKVIYIDVWATWCGPCIKEQPYLDSLRERFKNNSEVTFLSLSIDGNEAGWVDYVKRKNLMGFQYITDLSTLEPYFVSEIPRTILIDKNFDIYAMRGPMPSSAETISIIEKMLRHH